MHAEISSISRIACTHFQFLPHSFSLFHFFYWVWVAMGTNYNRGTGGWNGEVELMVEMELMHWVAVWDGDGRSNGDGDR